MWPTRLIILCLLIFPITLIHAQTCPANIDFEQGNFTNWQCYIGRTVDSNATNYVKLVPSPPTIGRHEIISASSAVTKDVFGLFPTLCPYGGQYSVKLGNSTGGAEAEGISYTFTVPTGADTFNITYYYAVVFQDPNHPPRNQPRFIVSAYDVATGATVGCSSFNFIADGSLPGFNRSALQPDVLYKEWTPASLQLGGMQGKQIRLEFKTADCTNGQHFGYAYIDVANACSRVMATASSCAGTNALVLNAPYGYQSYSWYNADFTTLLGTTQFVILSPPPANNATYHVALTPYPGYGCNDTVTAVPVAMTAPDTPTCRNEYTYCQFETPTQLTATPKSGNTLLWYTSATGGIAGFYPPTPSTVTPGTYYFYVAEKVLFGCESERKKITVTVNPIPFSSIVVNKARQCIDGNLFTFKATGLYNTDATYYWEFGDGQVLSAVPDSIVNHTYSQAGNYTVDLRIKTKAGCWYETGLLVAVTPRPVAAFTAPPNVCQNQTPIVLSDTASVPGGTTSITKWWWNLNGIIDTTFQPTPFTAPGYGTFKIAMVVITSEGCISDTATGNIVVNATPNIAFSYQQPLCSDKEITFIDRSNLPAGNTAVITKWNWTLGTIGTSALQNASILFPAGTHHVGLTVETNAGCTNTLDTVIVVDKRPSISVAANDSCVFKAVRFTATDQQQNTVKWYWNFGNGYGANSNMMVKSYNREGDHSFSVIAQSAAGCRDTLNRKFIIYDNKATAGRDTVAAMNEPVQLDAGGNGTTYYTWTPAIGLTNTAIRNPIATLDRDQQYSLYTINDKGCESRSHITIKRYLGPALYIPTGFTPNGDGLNDVLKVVPIGISQFKFFAVYNRFGERIYFTSNANDGWNGMVKGIPANSGTYIAYAEAIDYTGKPMMNKTTVVLIR